MIPIHSSLQSQNILQSKVVKPRNYCSAMLVSSTDKLETNNKALHDLNTSNFLQLVNQTQPS